MTEMTNEELAEALGGVDEEKLNSEPWTCEQLCKLAASRLRALSGEEDDVQAALRSADACSIGPNRRGGSKITLDFEDAGVAGKAFSVVSDAYNAALSSPPAVVDEVERKIAERLVEAYQVRPSEIAQICDLQLDRSGNLLGWLREAALRSSKGEG